jgi:hypothetical protein
MKTAPLILTLVGFSALTLAAGPADEPNGAPNPINHAAANHPVKPAPGGPAAVNPAVPARPNEPVPAGNKTLPGHPAPPPGASPAAQPAVQATRGVLPVGQPGHPASVAAKLPATTGNTPAAIGVVRNRTVTPVTLGGPPGAGGKTSLVVINGTAIKRKF